MPHRNVAPIDCASDEIELLSAALISQRLTGVYANVVRCSSAGGYPLPHTHVFDNGGTCRVPIGPGHPAYEPALRTHLAQISSPVAQSIMIYLWHHQAFIKDDINNIDICYEALNDLNPKLLQELRSGFPHIYQCDIIKLLSPNPKSRNRTVVEGDKARSVPPSRSETDIIKKIDHLVLASLVAKTESSRPKPSRLVLTARGRTLMNTVGTLQSEILNSRPNSLKHSTP